MKSWLDHPKMVSVRDRIVAALTPEHYRFRRVAPVIFICGGFQSMRRDTLKRYLQRNHPDLGIFYAERVWEIIAADPGPGALKMEGDLAELSDMVVVIVESPGTFAELGAFSHVPTLRKKLVPIMDEQYRGQNSFVNTGPISWIDQASDFKPTIWVQLNSILRCVRELEEKIALIPRQKSLKVTDLAASRKQLLFFICDLVAIVAPAKIDTIEHLLMHIIPGSTRESLEVPLLIGLAEAMGVLRKDPITLAGAEHVFFSAANTDALQRPYHQIKWRDVAGLRAEFASKLMLIPDAKTILREVCAHR